MTAGVSGRASRFDGRRRIWIFGSIGLIAIAVSAVVSTYPLLTGHIELRQLRREGLGLQDVATLRTDLTNFQVFVEPHMAKLSPAAPNDLASGALLAEAVPPASKTVVQALSAMGAANVANDLEAAVKIKAALAATAPASNSRFAGNWPSSRRRCLTVIRVSRN